MAAPARLTVWSAGDTLTASALNAEFTNLITALTDGSADLTINSLTLGTLAASGNATFGGNVTLGNAGSDVITSTGKFLYSPLGNGMHNLSIIRATTTNSGDSIKITSADGTALSSSNYGVVSVPGTTAGTFTQFSVTSDVTILLTGAHWGAGTLGDLTGAILRVLAINDNGTLRWGVAYLGGRYTLLTTDTNATPTNITLPEYVLCTAAVGSSTNTCKEVGFFRADFDDAGGAAEDLWAIQTGINDVVSGQSADGLWQPFNTTYGGFSSDPTHINKRWQQIGRTVRVQMRINANGTSNANTFQANLPAKARFANGYVGVVHMTNNSSSTPEVGVVESTVASRTFDFWRSGSSTVWTTSGTKGASVDFCYEIGPVASFIE